ncbi:MAG: transcriptional repressor [bacterium]
MQSRMSNQRQLVLGYLLTVQDHPTAETVYKAVKKKLRRISFGTVYRNLASIRDQGKILELRFNHEEAARYDSNTSFHFHFICKSCKAIHDVSRCPLPTLRKGLEIMGGTVDSYRLDFYGLCKDCSVKNHA